MHYGLLILVVALGAADVAHIVQPSQVAAKQAVEHVAKEARQADRDEWSTINKGVKISYCTSCAMKGAFMQVKNYVEKEFPGVPVVGEEYPIAAQKELLKKVIVGLQIGTAAMVFGGEQILSSLDVRDPQLVALVLKLKEKKFPVLMGCWILGNMVQNGLSSTGAFEVFSSGQKIFSKLESGRLPGMEELYDSLHRTLSAADLEEYATT